MTHVERSKSVSACPKCRQLALRAATIDRTFEIRYEGKLHPIAVQNVPISRCDNCGFTAFGPEANRQIYAAFRAELGLLSPEEIRGCRQELGLTAKELAERLQCAPESISRWERGRAIQSRAVNRHLRGFFGLPEVRELYEALDRGEKRQVLVDSRPAVEKLVPQVLDTQKWSAVLAPQVQYTSEMPVVVPNSDSPTDRPFALAA